MIAITTSNSISVKARYPVGRAWERFIGILLPEGTKRKKAGFRQIEAMMHSFMRWFSRMSPIRHPTGDTRRSQISKKIAEVWPRAAMVLPESEFKAARRPQG